MLVALLVRWVETWASIEIGDAALADEESQTKHVNPTMNTQTITLMNFTDKVYHPAEVGQKRTHILESRGLGLQGSNARA